MSRIVIVIIIIIQAYKSYLLHGENRMLSEQEGHHELDFLQVLSTYSE
jgi:hypothetical protein